MRRTFEADADAIRSVDTGVVLRRCEHVSLGIGFVELGVRNDADPIVERLVWEALVLEIYVVDVGRADGYDGGEQRTAVVCNGDWMIVERVAGGVRQERKVAQFRLLVSACIARTITLTKTIIA